MKAKNRLGGLEVCIDDSGVEDPGLPDRMRELLDRSQFVYVRAARLDDMVQGEQVSQYRRCIRWRSGDTDPQT